MAFPAPRLFRSLPRGIASVEFAERFNGAAKYLGSPVRIERPPNAQTHAADLLRLAATDGQPLAPTPIWNDGHVRQVEKILDRLGLAQKEIDDRFRLVTTALTASPGIFAEAGWQNFWGPTRPIAPTIWP